MKVHAFFFIAVIILFFSCNSGSNGESADAQTTATPPVYDASLIKGKVIDSILCKNNPGQSYALYLPSSYTPGKKYPCIYFFDAHGRGTLPLGNYKDIAEKYGFVLVGSNLSKNGTPWPVTQEIVKALMDDTRTRINIDDKRTYTAGFSGGSRVAITIAMVNGGIAGVIGCAAGFPSIQHGFQDKFDYFGIVGTQDFNLMEMEQLDGVLSQNGYPHQLLTSGGIHEWPSAADFQTATLWLQVNAMKEKLQPQNDTLIAALKNDYEQRTAALTKAGDWIRVYELTAGMIQVLDGLTDISADKKQLAGLAAGNGLKNAVAAHTQIMQEEAGKQQELAKQFTTQDEKWWVKKIAELNQNERNAKTKEEALENRRLLNYLGLVGYMNTNHALKTGDLPHAATYLKIFKMADPKNSDCDYLAAIYFIQSGNTQQAIASLNAAASAGYSDVSQLITEPAFNSLHPDAAFAAIVAKVRANYAPKP